MIIFEADFAIDYFQVAAVAGPVSAVGVNSAVHPHYFGFVGMSHADDVITFTLDLITRVMLQAFTLFSLHEGRNLSEATGTREFGAQTQSKFRVE